MGLITKVTGDLFTTDYEIIAHGVNCKGKFASGVAGQIGRRFPEVKRAYLRKYDAGEWKPGEIQIVQIRKSGPQSLVVNLATQDTYGKRGQHVIYDAMKTCFSKLVGFAESHVLRVAMPRIGAGLGGGDWEIIEEILHDVIQDRDVEIEVYTL